MNAPLNEQFCSDPLSEHGFLALSNRSIRREVEGMQSPTRTLDRGWGSCRDFAVLFAEATRSQFHGKSPLTVLTLFTAHRILQSAECILHLASGLLVLAFNFQILIAQNLSSSFFH